MTESPLPPLWTLDELAAAAGQSRRTLERRIESGALEPVYLPPATPRARAPVRVRDDEARRYLRVDAATLPPNTVHLLRTEGRP